MVLSQKTSGSRFANKAYISKHVIWFWYRWTSLNLIVFNKYIGREIRHIQSKVVVEAGIHVAKIVNKDKQEVGFIFFVLLLACGEKHRVYQQK